MLNNCYLCEEKGSDTIHYGTRDNPDINVLKCRNCGLVFLSSKDHMDNAFYEDSHMVGDDMNISDYLIKCGKDDGRRYNFLKDTLIGKKVLDFGCGAGGFINLASGVAELAHGVELDKALCAATNRNDKEKVKCFPSIDEVDEKYDVITLFHCLEHLKDPRGMLNRLLNQLNAVGGGSTLIIEVPSCDDALLTLYENTAFADFTYWSCHLYLFSPKTLELLFKSLDRKVEIQYIKQIQRYPLSNHLYWLSKGKPGGHVKWHFINNDILDEQYENTLAAIGRCDTLIASIVL